MIPSSPQLSVRLILAILAVALVPLAVIMPGILSAQGPEPGAGAAPTSPPDVDTGEREGTAEPSEPGKPADATEPAEPEEQDGTTFGEGDEAITITTGVEGASFFDADQRLVIFTGDVKVDHPQFHISCDELELHLREEETAGIEGRRRCRRSRTPSRAGQRHHRNRHRHRPPGRHPQAGWGRRRPGPDRHLPSRYL